MTYQSILEHSLNQSKNDRSFLKEPEASPRGIVPAAEPAPDPGQTDWLAGTRNPAVFDGLGGPSWWLFLRAAATLLATWRRRIAARRELAQLDIHSLRDAGIDPSIAAFEAAQPFWKPQISLRPIDDDR